MGVARVLFASMLRHFSNVKHFYWLVRDHKQQHSALHLYSKIGGIILAETPRDATSYQTRISANAEANGLPTLNVKVVKFQGLPFARYTPEGLSTLLMYAHAETIAAYVEQRSPPALKNVLRKSVDSRQCTFQVQASIKQEGGSQVEQACIAKLKEIHMNVSMGDKQPPSSYLPSAETGNVPVNILAFECSMRRPSRNKLVFRSANSPVHTRKRGANWGMKDTISTHTLPFAPPHSTGDATQAVLCGPAYGPKNTCPVDTLLALLHHVLLPAEQVRLLDGLGNTKHWWSRTKDEFHKGRQVALSRGFMDAAKLPLYQELTSEAIDVQCLCQCNCSKCSAGFCLRCNRESCACKSKYLVGHQFGMCEMLQSLMARGLIPPQLFELRFEASFSCMKSGGFRRYMHTSGNDVSKLFPLVLTVTSVTELINCGVAAEVGQLCSVLLEGKQGPAYKCQEVNQQ